MTSSINASSTSGVVTTADNSGQLVIQTNGVTALTVDSSQNVGIAKASITGGAINGATGTNSGMTVGNATNAINATNATNAVNATNATNAINATYSTTQASGDNSTAIATTAFVHNSSIGLGFGGTTWATTSNYANGVVYTNSNAYPIAISFLVSTSYGLNVTVYVNGYSIGNSASNNGGQEMNIFVIVPPSGTWEVIGACYGAWILQ